MVEAFACGVGLQSGQLIVAVKLIVSSTLSGGVILFIAFNAIPSEPEVTCEDVNTPYEFAPIVKSTGKPEIPPPN